MKNAARYLHGVGDSSLAALRQRPQCQDRSRRGLELDAMAFDESGHPRRTNKAIGSECTRALGEKQPVIHLI